MVFTKVTRILLICILIHIELDGFHCQDKKKHPKRFRVMANKMDWFSALIACRSIKMDLATVNNDKEHDIIHAMLKRGIEPEYWIGGSNLPGNHSQWFWMTTGAPISHYYWYKRQPNNYKGNQYCLSYYKNIYSIEHYKWNDMQCKDMFPFVCEYYEDINVI